MAIALVQSASVAGNGSGAEVTTPARDITGANFIVAATSAYSNGGDNVPSGLSDSRSGGGGWHKLTEWDAVSNQLHMALWWQTWSGSGTSYQVTTVGNNIGALGYIAFSGVDAYEQQTGFTQESAGLTVQPGALTAPGSGALYVTAVSSPNTAFTPACSDGFTVREYQQDVAAVTLGLAIAYLVDGAPTAQNPIWTAANLYAAAMAQFNATSAAFLPRLSLLGVG